MTMRIQGHSDDIVAIEGTVAADAIGEVGSYQKEVRLTIGSSFKGGIVAVVSYGDGGVWGVALSPIEEGATCSWAIRVGCEKYSAVVEIDCPPDTPLKIERRKNPANLGAWEEHVS